MSKEHSNGNSRHHQLLESINEKLAAIHLGLAEQTLRNWRHQRRGPAYYKIGRAVRYRLGDLEEFMSSVKITPM